MRLEPHEVDTGAAGSGAETVCGVGDGEWSTAGVVCGIASCAWALGACAVACRCCLTPSFADGVLRRTIFATGPWPASAGRTFASSTLFARWIWNWYLGVAAS